jgi:hypothetical protein
MQAGERAIQILPQRESCQFCYLVCHSLQLRVCRQSAITTCMYLCLVERIKDSADDPLSCWLAAAILTQCLQHKNINACPVQSNSSTCRSAHTVLPQETELKLHAP